VELLEAVAEPSGAAASAVLLAQPGLDCQNQMFFERPERFRNQAFPVPAEPELELLAVAEQPVAQRQNRMSVADPAVA
jgi:hypothetical protein